MRGLLLLLFALLLESTEGNNSYYQLSQKHREIVDKAIKTVNMDFIKTPGPHLDFSSVIRANDEISMLHVLLKPTSCTKKSSIHQDCKILPNATPQVSCVECKGTMSCFLLKEHAKIREAENKCPYFISGGTLFSQKGPDEQKTGCLGCI